MVPRIPNLTVGLVAALLLGLACAAPPTQGLSTRPAGSDSNARRAKAGASKLHNTPSIASATKMAAARMKRMQKTPSPGTTMARGSTRAHSEAKGLRAAVGRNLKRSDFKAQMRKTIERSGVVETAQALRRNGVTMTQALTDIFIAYDTDARRAQLQLGLLQGNTEQKAKCKALGWALVSVYFDMASGEDVRYNEGCSEEDLWSSGIGFPDCDENGCTDKCEKFVRTADMEIDWSASDPWYEAPCWTKSGFDDYCSASDTAKCKYNGTKARGTHGTTGAKSWLVAGNTTHTGGPGFYDMAADILWEYQGQIHDSCQVVLFYDFGDEAADKSGTCDTGSYTDAQKFGDNTPYPKLCSTANGGTSESNNDGTVRLLESSYTREFGGNKVPEWYVWMTYDEWDAYEKPWLTSPSRLPMHGKHMLKMMAESVGLACVTNDDASKYCFKEFFNSLSAMDTKIFPMLGGTFDQAKIDQVENALANDVCTNCNEILFDYMFLSWEDASDDDKYMRTFMEMTCSQAPNDDGGMDWCLPVVKDMEDDGQFNYDSATQAQIEAHVQAQGDLWCDDLCVAVIKDKEKDMFLLDLYANQSYMCVNQATGVPQACSADYIATQEKMLEQEEVLEASYCKVLERPAVGNAEPETHFCLEMPELHLDKFQNMVGDCFGGMQFDDPFNATQVAALPSSVTGNAACKTKFNEWIDPTNGWGCCVPALLDGFRLEADLEAFPDFIEKIATANNITEPAACAVPDGAEVSGTFVITNFNGTWYDSLTAAEKTTILKGVGADLAEITGVDRTGINITATATADTLTVTMDIKASTASQAVKVITLLESFDTSSRRAAAGTRSAKGIKSLTSNSKARRNAKLPVTGTTSGVAASYAVVSADTAHKVTITVEMPYTVAQFDAAKQTSYKKAVAKIAGTTPANIDLVITAARRASHGGGKINVATTIRAPSAKRLTEVGDVCASCESVCVSICLRVSACVRACSCSLRAREASAHVPFMT